MIKEINEKLDDLRKYLIINQAFHLAVATALGGGLPLDKIVAAIQKAQDKYIKDVEKLREGGEDGGNGTS